MFLLTVVVLYMGDAEFTFSQKWVQDETTCNMAMDTISEAFALEEHTIQFSLIYCNPAEDIK